MDRPMTLADLPEVGCRAPWKSDEEWRDFIAWERRAWCIGWLEVPTDAVAQLAFALYHERWFTVSQAILLPVTARTVERTLNPIAN